MNNTLLKTIFTSTNSVASLVLRVPVGIILAAHGAQKLFAWFGVTVWKEQGSGWRVLG